MLSFSHPLAPLILFPLLGMTVWAWHSGNPNLTDRRRALALAVRVALLLSIVLGLAGFALRLPVNREAVIFVADLSTSDARNKTQMADGINGAAAARPGNDQFGVVSAAGQAAVEQPAAGASAFDGFQIPLDASTTNLERGLELAGSIIPSGYRRHIVLLSDGQETAGNAVLAARLLGARDVRVDVVPESVKGGVDVWVDSVSAPTELRTNERSSLTVRLRSTAATEAQIDVYRDRDLVASRKERVKIGTDSYVFPQPPLPRGFHTYRVQITPALDSQPANNVGSAFASVGGPPRVLIIAGTPSEARNVLSGLRTTGIAADLRTPGQVPPLLSSLQRYASVVIVDTPAEILGPALMSQLVPYVRDLGHGLVVIGGQQAYGLGGYGQTPLEQALPVKMDLPKRPDLPSVGVALLVESLEASTPINISKEAAKGVVQLLTEQDRVAVNAVPDEGTEGWAVRLRPIVDRGAIARAIDTMQPGDPQSYAPVLRAAFDMLSTSPTRLRHIILLGDGDARDPSYRQLATFIHRHGMTISTVATNAVDPGDEETMKAIAHYGGGRFYLANDVSNVPKIFLHEARTVARSGIVRGTFKPRPVSSNPMLRDLPSMPTLDGYVATTPKRRAEVILTSGKLDPVLAGWQFGLGRSVAWTSDAAGLWSKDFVRSPATNRFWASLVSWTMPTSTSNRLFVATTRSGGQARITVDTPPALGRNPRVDARVVDPSGHGETVHLAPGASGQFQGSFDAGAQGSYVVTVEAQGAGHAATGEGGIAVPYPDEYRSTGTNMAELRAIAQAGGGAVLSSPSQAWSAGAPAVYDERALTDALWLLALLLLPVDIAIRRLIVSRRDIIALRSSIGRFRRPREAA